MKKEALLLLVLLAGIPGCGGKKYEMTYDVSTDDQVEETEYVAMSDDSESIRSFFNDETGEFEADIEDWVFADDFDFPVMAEHEDVESPVSELEVLEVMEVAAQETVDFSNTKEEPVEAIHDAAQDVEKTFKTVFFDKNSATLREDQNDILDHNIDYAKTIIAEYCDDAGHPCTLVIEGHADSDSEKEEISELRARTLADRFIEAGIPEECICVEARGADVPMVVDGKPVNESSEQWANRRGEVHMICA